VSYWPPPTWGIVSHDDVRFAAPGAPSVSLPLPA
jgi:hypothetical protein